MHLNAVSAAWANVALGQTVTAVSTMCHSGDCQDPSRLVDGNANSDVDQGSCAQTGAFMGCGLDRVGADVRRGGRVHWTRDTWVTQARCVE